MSKEVYSNCYACGNKLVEMQWVLKVHQYFYCDSECLNRDVEGIMLGSQQSEKREHTYKQVNIDGVKYVPATEVLVDSDTFVKALLAQYWGTPVNEEAFNYMSHLRILVSDGLDVNQGESFKEFIDRLAE